MPHVTDDTDILEETATTYERDEVLPLPLVQPPSRRGGFRLLATLRSWLTAARKRRARRVQGVALTVRKFETPLDVLSCKYPDLYIRVMTGVG